MFMKTSLLESICTHLGMGSLCCPTMCQAQAEVPETCNPLQDACVGPVLGSASPGGGPRTWGRTCAGLSSPLQAIAEGCPPNAISTQNTTTISSTDTVPPNAKFFAQTLYQKAPLAAQCLPGFVDAEAKGGRCWLTRPRSLQGHS